VPDYFTRIQQDEFFGWPYTYLSADNVDPRFAVNVSNTTTNLTNVTLPLVSINETAANSTVTPDVLFQAHSAALGMVFYNGTAFPDTYKNGAFVTFRGSWNRDSPTGYKVVFVPFDNQTNRPMGDYEDFITGFALDTEPSTVWGRPTGILAHPDGSLLFTDEPNGVIYRVSYDASLTCTNELTDATDNDGVDTDDNDDNDN